MQPVTLSPTTSFMQECLYAEYRRCVREAVEGEVVTRYQVTPRRCLCLGEAKPACISYHFANMFNGRMVLRIDDGSPELESKLTEEALLRDLRAINIVPHEITRVSAYFGILIDRIGWLIENGFAYCDSTSKEEREKLCLMFQASAYRDISVEENLKIWRGMLEGKHKQYAVRAKIDYKNGNHFLRDPVICVYSDRLHPVTGAQQRVYPTADFYTPLIDSMEGVTHAIELKQEHDHGALYKWFVNKYQLRKVVVQDYTELRFAGTPAKEENLDWLVKNRHVAGWGDLRMPTVQSVLKRGLLPHTITEYMLEQSKAKSTRLSTWEKLWSMNKKNAAAIAPKFTAIKKSNAVIASITNYELEDQPEEMIQLIPKNIEAGVKPLYRTPQIIINKTELKSLGVGDRVMLVRWGVFEIMGMKDQSGKEHIKLEYKPADEDYKNREKVMWLPLDPAKLIKVNLITYGPLLNGAASDSDADWQDNVNSSSKAEEEYYSEAFLHTLANGSLVQFDRVGLASLNRDDKRSTPSIIYDMIYVPDGKKKSSSSGKSKNKSKADVSE